MVASLYYHQRTIRWTRSDGYSFFKWKPQCRRSVNAAVRQQTMLQENPYSATLLSEPHRARSRVVVSLWWFVYLHPALSLALIYACWMLTTASLGRPPGFGEHPDNDAAHHAMHVFAIPAALLTLAAPFLIPIGLVWALAQPFAQRHVGSTTTNRVACLAVYLLMLAFVFFVYSSDPFGAVYWFWD